MALILSPFFIKVRLECKSQWGECPPEISSRLESLKSKNLFVSKRNASKILKNSFLVSDFSMQFKLPNILLINTIIKKPQLAIFSKATGKYFLLDEKGTILSVSDNSDLPTLLKDGGEAKAGDVVSNDDLFALKLIQGVYLMYQIRTGAIQNDTLVVDLPGSIRVIFPLRDIDTDVLLGSLRLIYTKVTADYPGKFSQIDMRYRNPVLR